MMNGYRAELLTIARSARGELPAGALSGLGRRGGSCAEELDPLLRCVSSGYLADGCSCRARVPATVASAAWRAELQRGRPSEGFFHFAWGGDVWLAYGRSDGRVRGVYCPAHRSEREQRLGYDPELVIAS